MPTTIDSLQIEIGASATSANRALDGLVSRLTTLKNSLGGGNFAGMQAMALGLKNISSAMQSLSGMHMPDYKRVASGIERLGAINVGGINATAQSIQALGNALNSTNLAQPSAQIVTLASSLAKLGSKGASNAITNIPKLALAFNQLIVTLSKAPSVSRNVVSLAQSMATLASSGGKVSVASTQSAKGLNLFATSAKRAKSSTGGLAAAIGKIYASYWLLFRLFSKLGDAINISSQITELGNVINMTFGESQNKIADFLQDSVAQFGMSEKAVKQYAARFQALGSAMAISSKSVEKANSFLQSNATDGYVAMSDDMADVSLTLTKLTADMASFYDVAQSDVAEDLQAIFTGMTKPLRKYGLDLTQATLKEFALRNGLNADIKSMSQAEKTMLRYQYVLANTTQLQGDFERTSKTWHNQVTILKAGFEQLANIVGTILINAFKGLLITVNQAMTGVISAMQNVLNALGQIFGWTVEVNMGGLVQDAEDYSDALEDASDSSKKLKANLLGIDELNVLSDKNSGSGSGSDIASGADTDKILSVNKTESVPYESWIKDLETLGSAIGDKLTSVLNGINWDSVYQGAKNFGTGLANFLNGLISPELFGALGRTIANSLNTVIYSSLSFAETFDWAEFGASIAEGVSEFFRNFDFGALADDIDAWVHGIWETIKAFAKNLDWGAVFHGALDFFTHLEPETVELVIGTLAIKGFTNFVINAEIGRHIAEKIGKSVSVAWATQVVPKLLPAMAAAFSGVKTSEAFSSAFGAGPTFFGGLVSAIAGVSGAVYNFVKQWREGFDWINETLMLFSIGLAAIGAILLGAPAVVAGVVGGIIAAIGTIAVLIHDNWEEISSYLKDKLEDIEARVNRFAAKTREKLFDLFQPLRDKLQEFNDWVKTGLTNLENNINNTFNNIVAYIGNKIEDVKQTLIGLKDSFVTLKDNIYLIFTEAVASIKETILSWVTWFSERWNEIVAFISTKVEDIKLRVASLKDSFVKLGDNIKKVFTEAVNDIKNKFTTWFKWIKENITTPLQETFSKVFTAIGGFAKDSANGMISFFERAINGIINAINGFFSLLNNGIGWLNDVTGSSFGTIQMIQTVSIPKFANGGYPEIGSLFIAGEAGAEMVGSINGKTGVASGAEITGIRDAIYDSSNQESSLLAQAVSLLNEIASKDMSVEIDGRELVSAVNNRSSRNGFSFA